MKIIRAAAFGLSVCLAAFGQAPPPPLEFDVASVRHSPATKPEQVVIGLRMDGSQARIAYFPMRQYVAMAYRVRPRQVSGPDWIDTERFDLNATLPAGATAAQIPEMLQTLLADRFQLKVHREKKETPVYALSLGKAPLKLKEVPPDATSADQQATVNVAGSGSAAGVSVDLGHGSYYTFGNNKFEAGKMSMESLARLLEPYLDRPIVNLTGLTGNYDFTLNLSQEDYQAMLIRAAVHNGIVLPPQALAFADGNSNASLFEAVQQVGLKLDARKAPLDSVVIDQLSKTPTDN